MLNSTSFIQLKNLSKSFPGVKALADVDMEICKGEIHALIGENGAGKSTLIKILSGIYQPDTGSEIYIDGRLIEGITPLISLKKGISVIYQDFSLFPNLTVAENIGISSAVEKGSSFVSWKEMRGLAQEALDRLELDIDIDICLEELSVAKQQLVAIARAIIYDARLIIMDEPTSSLSKHEVENLFKIMRKLRSNGISILFVSHKLDELFAVSDRFSILRDGKYVGTYDEDELDNDAIVSLMVGRKIEYQVYPKRKCTEPVLTVENLCKKGNFKDISFTLNRGEILGITGLVGAGRTEVLEAIFGLNTPDSGRITLNGKEININSPEKAIELGISLVPENRLLEGIVLRKTTTDNLLISNVAANSNSLGLFIRDRIREFTDRWIKKIDIRPAVPDIKAINLSGGNQQKVVIAKWLATNPKILLVDEPTNGIDIGSKANTHQLFRDLAEGGLSILIVSSELPEILAVCDRVLVMKQGRISAEFEGAHVTQSDIMNKAILDVTSQIER